MTLSSDTLSGIKTLCLGASGLICSGYAVGAFLLETPQDLPDWLPLLAGGLAALVIFVTAALAGPRNTNAALDESYRQDRQTAAAMGFWAALGMGLFLWLSGLGNGMDLAITLTSSAAVFLLVQVWLEVKGRL